MIEFVLLDLDDTILDFSKAERNALKSSLLSFGLRADDEILGRYHEINILQWQRLERGELTREQVKTERYRLLFEEFNIKSVTADEMTARYEKKLAEGHYFIDGAEELLERLYKGYRLFLVSNGALAVQKSRLKSAGIEKYFEKIFISQQLGYNKPDARFFESAFGGVDGFDREKAVIIGDSLTSDILGGKNFGIKTLWFNKNGVENNSGVKPDFTVKKLCEIEKILKNL